MSKRLGQHRRIIVHFDYDCFYASVVENENPALKSVPLAIQQKQIVVTCNYEARRQGLYKLQLITDAKRICPEAVIVLGEDLTRFRNASKALYNFLRDSIWSGKAERLGFDEVWLDCTDMVDYNLSLLNNHDLGNSFFCTDKADPTVGFHFDGNAAFGPAFPSDYKTSEYQLDDEQPELLRKRLILASHLARHLRHELEARMGYTSTVGIATNKTLSKLVGNVNKPKNQTTLMPVLPRSPSESGSVNAFMDAHDVGKVPGIGFKLSQKIRQCVLGREPLFETGLVYGGTKECVLVSDVRSCPGMGPQKLEKILGGPGSQKGIGGKVWDLLHGIDDSEVTQARRVPSQISQEDSYMRYLRTFEDVKKQLTLLSRRLIIRMHIDLMELDTDDAESATRRWMAHPRTLRLTTRPRPPLDENEVRVRTFQRISRSAPMPTFIFALTENVDSLAEKLVDEALVPMFRKLHPERTGWNLSLINIAVTNMAEAGGESKDSEGRDIGRMFRQQDHILQDFRVLEPEIGAEHEYRDDGRSVAGDTPTLMDYETSSDELKPPHVLAGDAHHVTQFCPKCLTSVPCFAFTAHERFHQLEG